MEQKIIYLDQNKWIDLARTVLEQNGTEKYEEVKNYIMTKIENEEWVFPLSIIHHLETMSRLDNSSRIKLAKVMGNISNNYSITPYMYIDKVEFKNSIYKKHNIDTIDLKDKVITKDFFRAAGLDGNSLDLTGIQDNEMKERMLDFANKFLEDNNLFLLIMSQEPDKELVTQMEKDKEKNIELYEKIREDIKEIPKQDQYKVFIGKEYMSRFGETLIELVHELGITKEELIPEETFETPESTLEFLESVPCFDVMTKLTFQIMKNFNRPFHRNDFNDIAFLATAIPYCDVVITEKSWKHHIEQTQLNNKYSTEVYKDINSLLNI